MKQPFVRAAVGAVLALTALVGSLPHLRAAATPPVGTLLLVAGAGPKGFSGDGGPATQALLNAPFSLAFDAAGNLFIAELENARVRKVTPDGIISTVVGGGKTAPRSVDGIPAAQALLDDADFLAFDGAGNLFVAGFFAERVWKVTPEGLITTVWQGGNPHGLAVDAAGNLFIGDWNNGRVQKVTPGGTITTIAGTGKSGYSGDSGPATQARLNGPADMAVDEAGNLFIADELNFRVRKVTPDGIITTIAGTGKQGYSGDGGPATQARLDWPIGLAVDTAGNLFLSDWNDRRVRKVTPDGTITAVAGTGQGPLSGVGGPAISAGLRPYGLAVDAAGNLFVTDSAWWDNGGRVTPGAQNKPGSEHVLEVVGVAAPGLLAGKPFPKLGSP